MPNYHLILRVEAATSPQTVEFESLAQAISHAEQLDQFTKADLWRGDEYLASVHASRNAGKVWTVGSPEFSGPNNKEDGPMDRLPGGT